MSRWQNTVLRTIKNIDLLETYRTVENDEHLIETIEELIIMRDDMKERTITENLVLYRYTKLNDVIRLLNSSVNKLVTEHGFMSTTMLPDNDSLKSVISNERYNSILRIEVPKGAKGVPLKFPRERSILEEYEFLLYPEQKMRLKKIGFDIKRFKFRFDFVIVN